MWSGKAFQVAGLACENARSPNFVRSRENHTRTSQYAAATSGATYPIVDWRAAAAAGECG